MDTDKAYLLGLIRGNIWRQMHGKIKTTNGYTFKIIEGYRG